jgi:hypothetical protein
MLLLSGCGDPPVPAEPANAAARAAAEPQLASAWFRDVAAAAGLAFTHDPGPPPTGDRYFMPQVMGSGAALFDYDNDGRLDIYLLQNAGPDSESVNRLYHQGADGNFTDVGAGSGLAVPGYFMGVACGDVNNDALPDVVLTEYRGARLFLNKGAGVFADVTKQAGIDNPLWGTSASFFDYDRDGRLDLVIVNYLEYDPAKLCPDQSGRYDYCGPASFRGTVTKLYHNVGPAGGTPRFEDVTLKSGLAGRPGAGLGVACADFDGDHWPDIFVANDGQPNHLWVNQRDGTFKEEGIVRGIALNALGQPEANMGVALGDVTGGGGSFDVFVTHLTGETNRLWSAQTGGVFIDRTAACGFAASKWRGTGFGTTFADFDNDGDPDLAVVNGRVRRAPQSPAGGSFWAEYAERNQVFANGGGGKFTDVSESNPAFCGAPAVSRGLACGDVDNDGAPDLLVSSVAGPACFYRGVAAAGDGPERHWLIVRAIDPKLGGRDAYGAEVTVTAAGRARKALVNPGYSYASSNDPRAHFGLGDADRIDSIDVLWPDGTQESFGPAPADQILVIKKGEGRAPRG